jgi:hypothetical protein
MKITTKKKKPSKTLPKLKKELEIVFNHFIRLRDKYDPCISCGESRELQAGHYYSVKGYDGLRFDEFNVHGECAGCNCFDESHLIGYGDNLCKKIGVVQYQLLKMRAANYKMNGYKFTRTELEGKIIYYKAKVKELESSF